MHKIIDCFIFYNEIDILKFRFTELYDVVDYFVLVEATKTFAGNTNQLYYQNNKALFKDFENKIIHIVVNDMPTEGDAWHRERHQRNCIHQGIVKLNLNHDDIILISDVDEIYDKKLLSTIKNQDLEHNIYAYQFDLYYYNLYCKSTHMFFYPKILRYDVYLTRCYQSPQFVRTDSDSITTYIKGNFGWHFSYFGNIDFIKNKLQNFSHQEFNNENYVNDKKIDEHVKLNTDLFSRDDIIFKYCPIEENTFLPENYEMLLHICI